MSQPLPPRPGDPQQRQPLPPSYGPGAPLPYSAGSGQPPIDGLRKNPLGLASLIIGAVVALFGVVTSLAGALIAVSGNYGGVGFVGSAQSVLAALLGLAALGLGIAGLLRRNSRKAAAGAGTALGAVAIIGVLNGLIYTLVFSLA